VAETGLALYRAISSNRWYRPIAFGLAVVLLGVGLYELTWAMFGPPSWRHAIGDDLDVLTAATTRLFGGESWYLESQLNGPHPHGQTDVLYPPVVAYAFIPFVWLGPVAIPTFVALTAGTVVAIVWYWRPAPWTWPLIVVCAIWPNTLLKVISGNPSALVAAVVALATIWPALGILALLKVTFTPFALIATRTATSWTTALIVGLLSLPFLHETLIYPQVLRNTDTAEGFLYSVFDWPMALIPVIAWIASSRRSDAPRPEGVSRQPAMAELNQPQRN
jgi:hypothetical protein